MVSRRNFISIILMMSVLLFMFRFSQFIKESASNYKVNDYASSKEEVLSGANQWEKENPGTPLQDKGYILLVTNGDEQLTNIVKQWCCYSKRILKCDSQISAEFSDSKLPELILLDAAGIEIQENIPVIESVLKTGVPVVFCNLPDPKIIQDSAKLKEILGIREVRANQTLVGGIHLFDGFFLGGEVLYKAETEKEIARQDLNLQIPWYVLGKGTKAYMMGLKENEVKSKEEYPALIWRNDYRGTKVFAVCDEYMSSLIGMGILEGFSYEINAYNLSPVVNARNVFIANFPSFANENRAELEHMYSRTPRAVFRDIMWPSIAAMTENNKLRLSCFFNPQYEYSDYENPEREELVFYLQQLKILDSEAGISVSYKKNVPLETVLATDDAFFVDSGLGYQYKTVYAEHKEINDILTYAENSETYRELTSIVTGYEEGMPVVSYLCDDVTLQSAIGRAERYTYTDDLTNRSILTVMGYSGVRIDLQDAIWPQQISHQWQNYYDDISRNIYTYWTKGLGFENTTVSESDRRIRKFLSLDYETKREQDKITLEISGNVSETYFLLRTHEEKIRDIRGGEYVEIDKNAYLITAKEAHVEVMVEPMSLEEQVAK